MNEAPTATLTYDGKTVELPVIIGDHVEKALDVRKLRAQTGWITLDPGYANTAACKSAITHIDGERGGPDQHRERERRGDADAGAPVFQEGAEKRHVSLPEARRSRGRG